jgi:ribosomal protein S6E (S10)
MEGGHGYTPSQVGEMTLDQILMLMTDRKFLLNRKNTVDPMQATSMADEDGVIKGRAADGTPIKGRIAGKSKARMLMEKQAAKQTKPRGRRERRNRKVGV